LDFLWVNERFEARVVLNQSRGRDSRYPFGEEHPGLAGVLAGNAGIIKIVEDDTSQTQGE
jgi:hypothetical protein